MKTINEYRKILDRVVGKKNWLDEGKKKIDREIKELKIKSENIDKAQTFIQIVAKQTQEKLKFHIEDIEQMALDACFPDEYKFEARFQIDYGKTSVRLVFLKDGEEVNPMDAAGGGVVDVASFALRIAGWSLGKTDSVIVLDEPFTHLSKDLHRKAGQILKRLSERLKLQIILITHNEDMVDISDKVFSVVKYKCGDWKKSEISS